MLQLLASLPSTSHPRYLMIAPLPPKLVQALNLEPKVVLLNISGTPTVLDRVSEAAALAFGLSRAEARVLDEMVAGRGAEEIAARIGTTPGTIRIQMKAIYAKSGIHRHAELVSYLLTTFEPDLRIGL